MDPQDFDFLDPEPQKYADPRTWSKGQNINQKLQSKFTLKTQIWTFEKRKIKNISWLLNGSSSYSIKTREKKQDKKFENSALLKNLVKFLETTWIRINFFPVRIQDPDPHQNYVNPMHWIKYQPRKQIGAMTAPITAQCRSQAACLALGAPWYGMDLANIPLPIIAAMDTPSASQPCLPTIFIAAGDLGKTLPYNHFIIVLYVEYLF